MLLSLLGFVLVVAIAGIGCCPSLVTLPFLLYIRYQGRPVRHPALFSNAVQLHAASIAVFGWLLYTLFSAEGPGGMGILVVPLYFLSAVVCWVLSSKAWAVAELSFQAPRPRA